MITAQVEDGLKGDKLAAFGSFGSDDSPYDQVLEEDRVDG